MKNGKAVFLTLLFMVMVIVSSAHAVPPLLTDEITKFKFTNYEKWMDNNGNGVIDTGDDFFGILYVTSIHNIDTTVTTWDVLVNSNEELTGIFKVSVADGTLPANIAGNGHLDFILESDDFIKLYFDTTPNWSPSSYAGGDPTLSLAWANSSDGDLYIEINPSVFYEGINDTAAFIGSVNRNWGNLAFNGTGYAILPKLWPELIPATPPFIHSYLIDMNPLNDPEAFNHPGGHTSDIFFESHIFTHAGAGGAWDYRSEDPTYVWATEPSCCIDIEKQVNLSLDNPTWHDADNCGDLEPVPSPHSAEYKLIVTNCGNVTLEDVLINDPILGIINENIGDLAPGDVVTKTGTDISQLAWDNVECVGSEVIDNIANATGTCAEPVGGTESADDSACWECEEEVGECRMTFGRSTVNDFDTGVEIVTVLDYVEGTYSEVNSSIKGGKGKGGKKASISNETTAWYTVGGQVGAPQANDPSYGEFSHTQHAGAAGSFTFHAGTHSGPDGTEISSIECGDEGWCTQARCAPFKQIWYKGVGNFRNNQFAPNFPSNCTVTPGPHGTLHYFRAFAADIGENDRRNRQISTQNCEWTPSGLDISEMIPIDSVPDPDNQHGGQICDKCPDYYRIEIHCTADPASPIIYEVGDFLTHGNNQMHPAVSQQCPYL
jgi:hypothetical protein